MIKKEQEERKKAEEALKKKEEDREGHTDSEESEDEEEKKKRLAEAELLRVSSKKYIREKLLSIYNGEKEEPDKKNAKALPVAEEQKEEVEFWEWDICMVFQNPDAAKSSGNLSRDKALKRIMSIFKSIEKADDKTKKRFRKAEEEVVA